MFNACIDLILEKFNVYPGSSTWDEQPWNY
jgi:hypothetical protein